VAPLWADLDGTGGTARYQTTGTAPNRVFTMEWLNWRWGKAATQPVISFQVRIYEGSNAIELNYRSEAGAVSTTAPYSAAFAGLRVHNFATQIDQGIELASLGTAPGFNQTAPFAGILTKPASGQLYRFTPTPNTLPTCPVVSGAGLDQLRPTSARIVWSVNGNTAGGTVRVHYGPSGFVLGSPADQLAPACPATRLPLPIYCRTRITSTW
jgi:hypothetical protein